MKRRDISRLRRSIGIVFQDYQLLSDRDVFGNLHYVMKATGWKNETDMRKRIEEVLSVVGLENKAFKMPFELSGGQQQRLVIACAFAKKPDVIILDEPTSGLDGANLHRIAGALRQLSDEGKAVLVITHDLELVDMVCDSAIRLPLQKTNLSSTI